MEGKFASFQRVINDENLLIEILIRIPTKPLVRSKCVCKQWNSIVSSDPFARIHTRFHPTDSQPTSGVFIMIPTETDFGDFNYRYHYLSLPARSLPPPAFNLRFSFPEPELVQSCNGLLLFSEGELELKKSYRMCVYNPATHQFKKLPSLILSRRGSVLGITLAFDPLRFQGFKVVCLINDFAGDRRIMTYYYSDGGGDSGGSWKKWEGNLLDLNLPYDVGFDRGLYWKGHVHWITLMGDYVYYNVENEKLGRFPSPPISPDKVGFGGLYELDGNLHFFNGPGCHDNESPQECKVYELLGYEQGWILKYNVDASEMANLRYLNGPDPDDYESPQECKVYEFSGYEQGWILEYNVDASDMVIQTRSQGSCNIAVDTSAEQAITCLVVCEEEEERRSELLAHLRGKMSAYDLENGTRRTLFIDATSFAFPYTASLALF